ncbi:Ubiquitinyl hydrolase 1 [Olea europaea subsp. europaea]|uniref:Ubiquitinyl hydrolase 1 n=1 Tax=Olea europaea subsp. europaea TaxID=158383 RepID=A0A8S0V8D4_OLEEU|nr:Ubiquitinyl hydrolase 1 [Olea europaea subsp. europaea]
MDQTPLCICFLGAPDLKKILLFLLKIEREILQSEERNFMDDSTSGTQIVNTTEKITFTQNDLVLELDDGFLRCKLNSSLFDDDSSSATSLRICYENDDAILDSDALMSWIFTGPSIGELLVSWTFAREEKAQQGKEILELREKKFNDLQSLCQRKYDHLNYLKAMSDVKSLCCEENFKREHVVDSVPQRYDSVLRKRLEDLTGSGNTITVIKNGYERAAIENVLKDAESDDDSSIIHAMQRKKHDVSLELCKVDARMLLDPASAYDFRSILVPLVKSYLQAHLEDLTEKEATKKSDAASEALLAELAFDSEHVFSNSGHMRKRMKDKKKSKEKRKNKDSKATGGNELVMIHDRTSEEISHISPPDGDDPNAAIAFAGTGVDLRQQDIEAVAPTSLRIALSNLYPDSNFFQEGQMNDASEVLRVIFDCLHQSFPFAPPPVLRFGSFKCTGLSCIVMYPENSFDELLNLIEMNQQLACDPEAGCCGKLNYIHPVLSAQPHVFVPVLGRQNTCESVDNITATLAALSTKIDISVLYHCGLDQKGTHCLVSMVCFYGQHYCCFAYKHEYEQWIMYDDETEIGGWNDVRTMCERGHLQPQVLFFEAIS